MKNRKGIFSLLAAVTLLLPLIGALAVTIAAPVSAAAHAGQIMTNYETETNNVYPGRATQYTYSLGGVVLQSATLPAAADWVTPSNYYDTGWFRDSWNETYTYSNFGQISQTNDPMSIPPTAAWATISSFQIEGTMTVPIRDTVYHYSVNGTDVLTAVNALLIPPNALWASLASFNDGWTPSKNHTYATYTLQRATPSVQSFTISSNSGHPVYAKNGDEVTVALRTDVPIAVPVLKIGGVEVPVSGSGTNWSASLELTGIVDEGTLPVYATVYTEEGTPGPILSATTDGSFVIYDNTSPVGALSINGGAAAANSANVILDVTTDGTTAQMRFSNDGTVWSGWETVALSKPWTMSVGDGVKTVYLQLRDEAGNVSNMSDSITLDTVPPDAALTINSGAAYATSTDVGLAIGNPDGTAATMQFSNDGLTWSGWEPYHATKAWTLAAGDGTKTVYLQLRDAAGNVAAASDGITLDTTAPSGTLVIDNGALYATSTSVTLTVTSDDSAAEMRFSNDGTSWSRWESNSATKGWTLAAGDGVKMVRLQLRDAAGNISDANDSITLDTTAPSGTLEIDNGALYAKTDNVTLSIGSDDTGAELRFSNDATLWSGWEPYTATKTWTLASGDGTKTVYLQLRDTAGHISAYSSGILLDTTRPVGSIVLNGGELLTTDPAVVIALTADDGAAPASGVVEASISIDGGATWSAWSHAASQLSVTLSGYGNITVLVKVRDAAGNESLPLSDDITLRSIPTVLDGTLNGFEDTPYTFTASDFGYTNDDGSVLDRIVIGTLPGNGRLELNGAAVLAGQSIRLADAGGLAFRPDADWNGITTLSWSAEAAGVASSGSATATIVVAAVNDPPTAEDLSFNTTANNEVNGQLKATDKENAALIYSIVDQPATGKLTLLDSAAGTFSYIPANIGTVTFTYRVSDGTDNSAPATVTIINKQSEQPGQPWQPWLPEQPAGNDNLAAVVGAEKLDHLLQLTQEKTELGNTVTVELKGEQWEHSLGQHDGGKLVIRIRSGPDAGVMQLDASMAKLLAERSLALALELDGRSVTVPAATIVSAAAAVSDPSAVIRIELAAVQQAKADELKGAAERIGAKVTAPSIHVQIYILSNGKHVSQSGINSYVDITYQPEEMAGKHSSTAVLLLPSGELRPLPTLFRTTEGTVVLRIRGLTQGTLALINANVGFKDTDGHWAADAIKRLADRFVVSGVGGGYYEPNRTATRAEFSAILVQALALYDKDSQGARFSDVTEGSWYAEMLGAANQYDLITGYADGTFRPNATITREEAMVILARADSLVGLSTTLTETQVQEALSGYSDAAVVRGWSREAVAQCITQGFMNGIGGELKPGDSVTRAQLALMVEKLLQKAGYI
ncbi:S-layer homology domain-containing protein [Paenibacillus spongiae]|uniref:S-layer homology domain-containing protein n=1 Tax=Paenibacillus spongiae TaxID=2909671 RepID=A0ABY5S0P3_9BACL|nr:S-layer homology domain-containing protein [Paenibacillus spongiae]UVI27416.1 S-layer homology domain-containing protein [Paenibacillus spongiae]